MRRLALLLLPALLLPAACGGSSGHGGSGGALPSVSGSFGQKPTLSFPSSAAPTTLQSKVLSQGNGPVVPKGSLLVANYLGQIWHGKVFDNSYDRHVPAGFPIGVGQVVPGWDKTLVGVHAGSRMLLVLPPADGYGASGNAQAGIKGTDTLVFVVDVLGSYPKGAGGDAHAVPQTKLPAHLPRVSGALGAQPSVTIPKGTPVPKKQAIVVLDKGSGAPVKPGAVVLQYLAVDWATGQVAQSTWSSGYPTLEPVAIPGQQSALDGLVGIPVGSRVLVELPKIPSSPSYAIVVDVVGEPTS